MATFIEHQAITAVTVILVDCGDCAGVNSGGRTVCDDRLGGDCDSAERAVPIGKR